MAPVSFSKIMKFIDHIGTIEVPFSIEMPDGNKRDVGEGEPQFHVALRTDRAVKALGTLDQANIAEAYLQGDIDLDGDMISPFALRALLGDHHPIVTAWRFIQPLIFGQVFTNRAAITSHYDLDPRLFLSFLDPVLPAYSQGVYENDDDLTPYSQKAGALAMVPGSHKLARQPRGTEMRLWGEQSNPDAVSMDLEPGDAVVWHGNTWHGSFARQLPGIRMNLAVYFNRQYIQTQERHGDTVPQEVLDRHANDERFKVLLGSKQPYGWQLEGPDYEVMARNPRGLYD